MPVSSFRPMTGLGLRSSQKVVSSGNLKKSSLMIKTNTDTRQSADLVKNDMKYLASSEIPNLYNTIGQENNYSQGEILTSKFRRSQTVLGE